MVTDDMHERRDRELRQVAEEREQTVVFDGFVTEEEQAFIDETRATLQG